MEDPGLDCDNDLWDRMLQAGMLYAPTKGRGVPPTILEEPEPADDLVENVIGNTSNFRFHLRKYFAHPYPRHHARMCHNPRRPNQRVASQCPEG
jgi:hypothetical protein